MDGQFSLPEKEIVASLYRLIKIRRTLGKDFPRFRQQYFPHYHKHPDGPFQEELSKMLNGLVTKRGSKIAIAAPRNCAKSTITTLQYVIYCICYKLENFIVIISSTADQARGFLNDIKQELETNEHLIKDFPDICEIGAKPGPPRWTQHEIVTRNKVKVIALGVGQQIRGRRNREFRPSLVILDDIESNEGLQNMESFNNLEDWLTKAVLKAGSSTSNFIYVGTIHHYGSLLAKFTNPKEAPGWDSRIYKSVISWAERSELWERWIKIFHSQDAYKDDFGIEAAKRFLEDNKTEMLKGTQVLWPASKSYYDLMVMREQDGHVSFDSEMQNEPTNPRDAIFNLNELHYWDDRFGSEEELLASIREPFFYGACDPSMGRENKNSDFSAIVSVVKDTKTGTIYVIDSDIARRPPDRIIDDILAYQRRRRYRRFAFEANNFQEFMAMELEKRSEATHTYVRIEEVKHVTDKVARIESLQPLIKNGTIQFSKKHYTLLEQMKFFPRGVHDDGLDALQMVVDLAIKSRRRIMTTVYESGRVETIYNE
jgi:predicted phage terminase large subunit-like protein